MNMNSIKTYKYYIIYKTKSFNNMQYIWWHATNDLNDNYLGSGKLLKRAIKKYGKDKFSREFLEFCSEENVLDQEKF